MGCAGAKEASTPTIESGGSSSDGMPPQAQEQQSHAAPTASDPPAVLAPEPSCGERLKTADQQKPPGRVRALWKMLDAERLSISQTS